MPARWVPSVKRQPEGTGAMNVRRLEIDFQAGRLTVDADVNEEWGREFEFDLAMLPDIQPLAEEIARHSQRAVIDRLRVWLARLEREMAVPTVTARQAAA